MNKENIIDYVVHTPHNPNKKVLNDMLETLIEENGGTDNPTYSWNDLTDKPFGEEDAEIFNVVADMSEQSYFTTTYFGGLGIETDSTVKITVNGVTEEAIYRCENSMNNNHIVHHESSNLMVRFSPGGGSDNDAPGYAVISGYNINFLNGVYNVTIEALTTKTIDEKFIPDTIARVSDIPEGSSGSWNDLTDKPFGEEADFTPVNSYFVTTTGSNVINAVLCDNVLYTGIEIKRSSYNYELNGAQTSATVFYVGNPNLIDESIEADDSYPFCLYVDSRYDSLNLRAFPRSKHIDGATSHIYQTGKVSYTTKQLDEKYIPETIAKVSYVDEQIETKADILHTHFWNDLKNRPFGDILIPAPNMPTENIPLTTIHTTGEKVGGNNLVEATYIVYFDGEYYNCSAEVQGQGSNGIVYLGNLSLCGAGSDNGLPFCFKMSRRDTIIYCYVLDESIPHIASATIGSLHKTTLDEKYIPDTIARVSDIPESFSGSWNDLKDKPFGEEIGEEIKLISEVTVEVPEGSKYADLPKVNLQEGITYKVVLNDVVYECLSRKIEHDAILIGNGEIYGGDGKGNGEPFSCDNYVDGTFYLNVATPGTYTISISYLPVDIIKIDPKFLPEISQPVYSWNDLTDRPFGEIVEQGVLCEDMSWNGIVKYNISVDKWKKCDELIPNILDVVNKLNGVENTIVGYENKPGHLVISEDNRVVYGYENNILRYLIILEDNVTTTVESNELTFAQSGFYVNIGVEGTYPVTYSYTQFKTLDEQYIPETIARIEQVMALLDAFEITVEDIDEICGATSTETILDEAILGETTV